MVLALVTTMQIAPSAAESNGLEVRMQLLEKVMRFENAIISVLILNRDTLFLCQSLKVLL